MIPQTYEPKLQFNKEFINFVKYLLQLIRIKNILYLISSSEKIPPYKHSKPKLLLLTVPIESVYIKFIRRNRRLFIR